MFCTYLLGATKSTFLYVNNKALLEVCSLLEPAKLYEVMFCLDIYDLDSYDLVSTKKTPLFRLKNLSCNICIH